MKTEQEIRQMVNTCNVYHSCALCPYNPEDISRFIGDRWKGGCPNYDRQLVYAMGKGYGDVSEYKAEIERLRTTLGQCNTELNSALESLKSQCREIGKLKAEVKQAQIDILNKAKEKFNAISRELGDDCDLCGVSAVCSCRCKINELIQEVQNGEDKG